MATSWLRDKRVYDAIHEPAVRGQGAVAIIAAVRKIGEELGHDVAWLEDRDLQSAVHDVQVRAKGSMAIVDALLRFAPNSAELAA